MRDYELLYKKLKTKESKDALDRGKMMLARSKRKNYYKILGIPKTGKQLLARFKPRPRPIRMVIMAIQNLPNSNVVASFL